MKGLVLGVACGALGVGFMAGRSSAPDLGAPLAATAAFVQVIQNDPRELIPLVPGPGDAPVQPSTGQPGPQAPGQQPGEGECVLMFGNGQFFRLPPGALPGQGQGEQGNGQPGGDQELIPLEPFDGPPGLSPQPTEPSPDLRV